MTDFFHFLKVLQVHRENINAKYTVVCCGFADKGGPRLCCTEGHVLCSFWLNFNVKLRARIPNFCGKFKADCCNFATRKWFATDITQAYRQTDILNLVKNSMASLKLSPGSWKRIKANREYVLFEVSFDYYRRTEINNVKPLFRKFIHIVRTIIYY